MNSKQIYSLISRDLVLNNNFRGVYSADTIYLHKNGFYIVNKDKSFMRGKHWVVYFKNDKHVEFFDSCGQNGYYYNMCESDVFNNINLQGKLPVCGYYCLCYCIMRCRGISIKNIIKTLAKKR